ncbi:glutathione transferase GST 23-like [Hordeum vulgare]|nr:glutathione transferase GST 23-like [Hordeum vulgare]
MEAAKPPVLWLRAYDCSHGAMQVHMEYTKRRSMLLGRGWKAFSRAHNLEDWHVLCFKLAEDDMLSVKFYGRSGFEPAHHRRDGTFTGCRFFGGDEVGFLDIVLGCGSYWLAIFEEVTGVQLVDTEAFPLFHAWLRDFEAQGKVRETIPSMDRLLEYARPPPDAGHHGRRHRCRNGRGLGRRPTPAPPATAPPAATTADIAVDI